MSIDFPTLVADFKQRATYASVEFIDQNGDRQTDSDPCFSTISGHLQSREYLKKDELLEIGRWKVQGGRIDRHLEKNSPAVVKEQSELAFTADKDETRIAALSELTGVRVPVASTILAMWKPTKHAVIDYRALRALPAAKPQLLDHTEYAEFAEFLELFRTYGSDPSAYEFYIDYVRELAEQNDLLPREVDMALWEYDRKRTES